MRNSKKWMTAVLTAAMVVSQVIPVFATSADVTGGGTSSGTANILAYSVDKIVVPTTLKVALNPDGFKLKVGYVKIENKGAGALAWRNANHKIYQKSYDLTKQDWVYKEAVKDTVAAEDADKKVQIADSALESGGANVNETFFKAKTIEATAQNPNQVVSLNYGIANKSTKDKTVQIDIRVTQDTNHIDGKKPIKFVGTAEEATYGSGQNNAKQNEMNMFLQVVASKAAPTTDTFVAVTTFDATSDDDKATVFYEKDKTTKKYKIVTEDDGTANDGLFTDEDKFNTALAAAYGKKFYKQTTTIGPEITGAQLSDVTFPSEADDDTLLGAVAFAEGKENKANASIGFLLGGAKYGIDSDEGIEAFTTSQSELASSMDLRDLGGTAGFTITGVMNKKTDWTKADTAALFIQPTYKVSDTEGGETYVNGSISDAGVNSTNPYNQIKLNAAPSIAVAEYEYSDSAVVVNVDLGMGNLAATGIESVSFTKEGSNVTLPSTRWSYEDGKITFSAEYIGILGDETRVHHITFDNDAKTVVDITLKPAD